MKLGAFFVLISLLCVTSTSVDYWQERKRFIELEESQMIGASIELSDREKTVNEILMNYKLREYDDGFVNPGNFLPFKHFFHARKDMEKSKVFNIIKRIPKGAMLHGHDTAIASNDFVYNLTYRDNLYACIENKRLKLHFFDKILDHSCNWTLMTELRKLPGFDDYVKSQLTIIVDDPYVEYPNINVVWRKLTDTFATVTPMLLYKPIFQEYFYQALQEFYDDNVSYFEFRGTLPAVYDLSGHTYNPIEVVGLYEETAELFKRKNPDFQSVGFIYAPNRNVDNKTLDKYIETVIELKKVYPGFVIGFDLVGQEDLGKPLTEYVNGLLKLPKNISVYFHAAETNWYGSTSDENLVDAILLGTKRIGHGYAITKHPRVSKLIKERGIGIEVCPISNQVLGLVSDLRNHPAATLIAQGYPVVIGSDDPSFWGAKGLSYDWYVAFMGMASRNADLKFLKQLAINSIEYSSLSDISKELVRSDWNKRWDKFIDDLITEKCNVNRNSANMV